MISGNVSPLNDLPLPLPGVDVTAREEDEDDADEQASLSYSVTVAAGAARSPDSQVSGGLNKIYSKRQLEKMQLQAIMETTHKSIKSNTNITNSKLGATGGSKGSQVSLGASVLSAARGAYNHTGPHYNGSKVGLASGYEYRPKFRTGGITNKETLLREQETKDFSYKSSMRQSEVDMLRRIKQEEVRTRQAERRDFHKKLQREIAFNNKQKEKRVQEEQDIKEFRRQMAKEDQAMRRQAEEMVRIAAAQEAFVEYQAQVEDNNYAENLSQIMAQQRSTVVQYAGNGGLPGSRSASKQSARKSSKGSSGTGMGSSRKRLSSSALEVDGIPLGPMELPVSSTSPQQLQQQVQNVRVNATIGATSTGVDSENDSNVDAANAVVPGVNVPHMQPHAPSMGSAPGSKQSTA